MRSQPASKQVILYLFKWFEQHGVVTGLLCGKAILKEVSGQHAEYLAEHWRRAFNINPKVVPAAGHILKLTTEDLKKVEFIVQLVLKLKPADYQVCLVYAARTKKWQGKMISFSTSWKRRLTFIKTALSINISDFGGQKSQEQPAKVICTMEKKTLAGQLQKELLALLWQWGRKHTNWYKQRVLGNAGAFGVSYNWEHTRNMVASRVYCLYSLLYDGAL